MTPLRVLIVEDEPITLQALVLIVRSLGCEPAAAATAEEGLNLALSSPHPDFALIDLKLQGSAYDGLELIRRLVGHPDLSKMKTVAHTASVSEDQRKAARHAGACGILLKPFRTRDVAAALNLSIPTRPISGNGEDSLAGR
ncbi:MAG: response regulator [Candidatus Sericytochromatia bacterium]|nr:response regulator [Candidatus Sericytochromatia bacterium]